MMKFFFFVLIYLIERSIAAFNVTQITEVPLTCSIPNCTECEATNQSCTRCQIGYFLFMIPQTFDPDLGYLDRQYICVECPNFQNSNDMQIPCGDCVDFPQTWSDSRQCSYYYQIDSPNLASKNSDDIFMYITMSTKELYFVNFQKGAGQGYTGSTILCTGCDHFCGNNKLEKSCNTYSPSAYSETFQTAVVCAEGYFWNKNACARCDTTADFTCSKQVNGKNIIVTDISVMLIPYLDLKSCQACPASCTRCDYSTNGRGLEIHTISPRVVSATDIPAFKLRCRQCAAGLIPNPMGICVLCSILNCSKCYFGQTGSPNPQNAFMIKNGEYIYSYDDDTHYNTSDFTQYCGVCNKGYQTNVSGQCDAISGIPDCHSAVNNKCLICKDGMIANQSTGNCSNFSGDQTQGCGQYLQSTSSTYCLSCNTYDGVFKSTGYPQYVDQECDSCDSTGLCQECTQWSWRFNMIDFMQLRKPVFSSYDQQYYEDDLGIKDTPWCLTCVAPNIIDPWTGTCYGCLGSCKQCSHKFGTPQCSRCDQATGPSQTMSGANIRLSQSTSLVGCDKCSDYEDSCSDLPTSTQKLVNPYHYSSPQFYGKVQWTKAGRCRPMANVQAEVSLYNGRFMFFNSLISKCVVCTTQNCKKRVVIPYFIDAIITDDQEISDYYASNSLGTPEFFGYNAKSLSLMNKKKSDANLVLGQMLLLNNLYIKLSQEGVEELEFKVIFVNTLTGSTLDKALVQFDLSLNSKVLEMLPYLVKLKITVTTMKTKVIGSIGQYKMPLYVKSQISFGQITDLELNMIDILPLHSSDPTESKVPFFIKIKDTTTPVSVSFINCKIYNTDSVNAQKQDYIDIGQSSFFQLYAPQIKSLVLQNFELSSIYYPPQINFFDPGTSNGAVNITLSNTAFSSLSFNYVTVFGLNNTNSQITLSSFSLKDSTFDTCSFISELSGLESSYLKVEMTTITIKNVTMLDSYFAYVMNAVRFRVTDLLIEGPFLLQATKQYSNFISSNLLSISGAIIRPDQTNPSQVVSLVEATLISTPAYSLLVQETLQINHRYTNTSITGVQCELSTKTSVYASYVCFMDLKAPYNKLSALLNANMVTVTITNTQTSQTSLQTSWSLVQMKEINDISLKSFSILDNHKFQGISIYNPLTMDISTVKCGDSTMSSYNTMYALNPTSLQNFTSTHTSSINGYCMDIAFCQDTLSIQNVIIQNYVGLNQPAINIQCTPEIKSKTSTTSSTISVDTLILKNSLIFLSESDIQVSPMLISNPYAFDITFSNANFAKSMIYLVDETSVSVPSSPVLVVDSISSNLNITDSIIDQVTCSFSASGIFAIVSTFSVYSSTFQKANMDYSSAKIDTVGAFINAKAAYMVFSDLILEDGFANNGSGMFLETMNPGEISFVKYSKFSKLRSSTNSTGEGRGAAIYIDQTNSDLSLSIVYANFENVFARTIGGALYINSGAFVTSVTISKSLFINVYSPQASLFYSLSSSNTQIITISECTIEWNDQQQIIDFMQSLCSDSSSTDCVVDQNLLSAFEEHSQVWMSKGTLITNKLQFQGIRYQALFKLYQLLLWVDTSSTLTEIYMSTYPLVYSYLSTNVTLSGTHIQEISPFDNTDATKTVFQYFESTERVSAFQFTKNVGVTLSSVNLNYNSISADNGLMFFDQMTSYVNILNTNSSRNYIDYGVLNFAQTSSRLLSEGEQNGLVQDGEGCSNLECEESYSNRFLVISSALVTITGSRFENNQGKRGAAIHASKTNFVITSTYFLNNTAQYEGGAIYSTQTSTSGVTISLNSCTFKNNFASSGAAYIIEGVNPSTNSLTPNVFDSNVASYFGGDAVESPYGMQIIYNGRILKYKRNITTTIPTITFYGSGQSPGGMVVQYVDSSGSVLRSTSTSICTVSLNYGSTETVDSSVKLSGTTQQNFNEYIGGFNFTNIMYAAKAPSTLKAKFYSSNVIIPIKDASGVVTAYDHGYYFPLIFSFRSCVVGEIYESSGQCVPCPSGKYSLDVSDSACSSCPKIGVEECPGNNIIKLNPGYWRKGTDSDAIVECTNASSNCIGGRNEQLCTEGNIGALCEECDLYGETWGEAYALSSSYQCGKCSEISSNLQKVIIISIWTLITTLLSVKSTIEQVQSYIMLQILIKAKIILGGVSSSSSNQAGVLIKILTSYFQVISALFTFKMTIPSFFSSTTDAVGNPSQQMSVSMDCFFLDMTSSDMHVVYFRLIWQLINPFFFITTVLIIYIVGVILKKIRKNTGYIWCTAIFLFVTLQPSIVSSFISTASCREIGGVNYIKANVSLECYTSEHTYRLMVLVIPCIILWVGIIPLLFFTKLYRSRDQVQIILAFYIFLSNFAVFLVQIYSNIWIRYRYGYLYMEYNKRAYFWEFVKMFQKIMLIIIINIYDNDTKVKGVLCFLTVVIYLILSYVFNPYNQTNLNKLDQRGNEACAISMIMGVFIYGNSYEYLIGVGYFVLVVINLVFIFDCIRQLVRGYTKILDDTINKYHEKVMKYLAKFPKIQAFFEKKHASYVPLERVTELWKLTSKHVHNWFEKRKINPNAQLIDERSDKKGLLIEIADDLSDQTPKSQTEKMYLNGFKTVKQRKSQFNKVVLDSLIKDSSQNLKDSEIQSAKQIVNTKTVLIKSRGDGDDDFNLEEINLKDDQDSQLSSEKVVVKAKKTQNMMSQDSSFKYDEMSPSILALSQKK